MQPPPPLSVEPAGHEATHRELLQSPDAQLVPAEHGWPLVERQAPPTSCVPAGHTQLLVAEAQTDPVGDWQTHP